MACASATTAKGQALISTAFNAFEDFLSDAVKFKNMDECISFICNIIKERPIRVRKDDKWVNNKSSEDVCNRLLSKFMVEEDCDIIIIKNILSNLDQEDLNRIYYKSNMYEFFRNSNKATQYMKDIYLSGVTFMNPKDPPKIIQKSLNKLREAVLEYVHYNYQFTDRVTRLKVDKRKSVITIDTDSNFINLGPWVDFVYDEILSNYEVVTQHNPELNDRIFIKSTNPLNSKSRKKKEKNDFRIVMTMINILDSMISSVLDDFLERTNVPKDNPGNTSMKNEFLYTKILCTPAKKHYQAVIRLQEGNLLPYDMDIKGWLYSPFRVVILSRIFSLTCWDTLKLSCLIWNESRNKLRDGILVIVSLSTAIIGNQQLNF